MYDDFDIAPTRTDTYNLLKVFSRKTFQDEFIQYKACEVMTKKIIAKANRLNLTQEQLEYLNTNKFKDQLFLLLKHNFSIEDLRHVANVKITEEYKNILTQINSLLFDDLLNGSPPKYEDISMIIVAFYDYICNDSSLSL